MVRYIDLFAGAGGWDAGIKPLGWTCLGMYEMNPSACKTLRFNYPNTPVYEVDLSQHLHLSFPQVDVVIGSPPCQGFSNEGKKRKDDLRNNLVGSYLEIITRIQPKVWVFENVPGFMRLYKGHFYREFVKKVEQMGYHLTSGILDASEYGVPQKRKRFIGIACKDKSPSLPVGTFNHSLKRSLWDAISDLPKVGPGEKIGVFDYFNPPQSAYQTLMRAQSSKIFNHTTQNHSQRVLEKIKCVPIGGNMQSIVGEFKENKKHYAGGYRRAKKEDPSYTAYWTRGMTSIHPEQHRFLSPRECARIQSFPDQVVFQGTTIQHYTQICNAVPPLLAQALCQSIQEELLS